MAELIHFIGSFGPCVAARVQTIKAVAQQDQVTPRRPVSGQVKIFLGFNQAGGIVFITGTKGICTPTNPYRKPEKKKEYQFLYHLRYPIL